MIINLIPQVVTQTTEAPVVKLDNSVLEVNGEFYDLSLLRGGVATALEDTPFMGQMSEDEVTILYQYSTDIYSSSQSMNKADFRIELLSGQTLKCPLIKREVSNVIF